MLTPPGTMTSVHPAALFMGGVILTALAASAVTAERTQPATPCLDGGGRDIQEHEDLLQAIDPELLRRAAEKGLYDRDEYPASGG